MTSLTRARLLKSAAVGAAGLAVPACRVTGGSGQDVTLYHRGGDAWTWNLHVTGTADGCTDVRLAGPRGTSRATVKDGWFAGAVPLGAGDNRVTASCGSSGGGAGVVYRERLAVRPTARIDVAVKGRTVTLDGSASEPTEPTGAPITGYAWTVPPEITLPDADTGRRITVEAPSKPGEYYVTLEVADAHGNTDRSTTYFVVDEHGPRAVDMAHEAPAWVSSAIVYGVIPFLFGHHPLRDVTARLEYLRDLGVNALWLSPITNSPPGDFGYAVTDYFGLNPRYGTKDDFHGLVETAHRLGIRVLMDFVPNHSSDQHPYFVDTTRHGKRSPYYTFYDRDRNGEPTHYFDWANLPNFNYSNPDMRRFITEAFAYWVREFDVDGFRVDACWGVRRRRPDYWDEWRREMKRIKPDLLLIAEATARDRWYYEHGFDVAYDWTNELGHWAWQDVFYDTPSLGGSLHAALEADVRPDRVFHFLNNNDTGPRFVSVYDSDTTRVAAALLLTLPGVPCIYTGDEVGAQYQPYEDTFPISWDDPMNLRPWYRRLCALRAAEPALTSPEWRPVRIEPEGKGLFAFLRGSGDARPILIVLNFARDVFAARLDLPPGYDRFAAGRLNDLLGGAAVPGSAALTVPMTALSARAFVPEST